MATQHREDWLTQAAERLLVLIAEKTDLKPPKRVQVSCGFPQHDRNGAVIGCCYPNKNGKGVSQLFISPTLTDPIKVLYTLLHELIHAADDCQHQHSGPFVRAIRAVGLAGKPTATTAEKGSELYEYLQALSAELGGYPHLGLNPGYRMRKKQGTRMVKCSCDECGYTVRTTQKWLDVATPLCPDSECDGYQFALSIESKDDPK